MIEGFWRWVKKYSQVIRKGVNRFSLRAKRKFLVKRKKLCQWIKKLFQIIVSDVNFCYLWATKHFLTFMKNPWQWIKKPFQIIGNGVIRFCLWWKKNIKVVIFVFIFILSATLVSVIFSDNFTILIAKTLSENDDININKIRIIELIGWGISGLIAFIAVTSLGQRAAALDEQNKLVVRGHVQERFKTAIEHLGDSNSTVCIASFYEFYHLVCDNKDLRQSIFDILCAYLRNTTKGEGYQKEEPTEEVQSLLNILFKKRKENRQVFDAMHANLKQVCLIKANLTNAKLISANLMDAKLSYATLTRAKLIKANLMDAKLSYANLSHAKLSQAKLSQTDLTNASLFYADLTNAILHRANLTNAILFHADLTNAKLHRANLTNANLFYANLTDAKLHRANLTNAILFHADLTNAILTDAKLHRANLTNANLTNADLTNADLSYANLIDAIMPEGWEKIVHTLPDGTVVNKKIG